MKKQLFAVLLVVVVALGSVAYASDEIMISPEIMGALDLTAAEWYGNEAYNELLAALVMLQMSENEAATDVVFSAFWKEAIYIAKDGLTLQLYFFGDDSVLVVLYNPLRSECIAGLNPIDSYVSAAAAQEFMQGLKRNELCTEYRNVSSDGILEMLQSLAEILD